MEKQIIFPDFINRLFATALDLSLCAIITLFTTAPLGNIINSRRISELGAKHGISIDESNYRSILMENPDMMAEFADANFLITNLILLLLQFAIIGVYLIFFWNKFGTSPGKMALSMKIVDSDDYSKPTLNKLIKRFFGYFTFPIGLWSIIFTKRGVAMHDKLSGTLVIKR